MTFFKEGDNPQPRTPAAKCYAFTFGVDLANGKTTPCTAQGQKADYVYGDTVDAVENGYGVPILSRRYSGGVGVPCLAGGAVAVGADVIVGMVNFTNNDGVVVSLPVAISADDADDGDFIVARATMGSSATEADTDINAPSLALDFYDNAMQVSGGTSSFSVITLPVTLADVAANGDTLTEWTPGFAGEIVSYAFAVTDPVTTAAKTITLNAEINGTDVTGGVLVLTSANTATLGAVIAATAITAANAFDANDTVSFEASAVTAFVEGAGNLLITVRAAVV